MSEKYGIVKCLANIMSAKKLLQQLASSGEPIARNVSVCQSVDSRCQCFKNENQRPFLQLRDHDDHKMYFSKLANWAEFTAIQPLHA